ncbi:leucine-rich repeat transmembrane neuronal protein 3-like [Aedes albopictus]|uniref:Leucine-rich repeat protein n=1 Tax=Aedes albopictus TaxID=7160 RepID=A0ABM1Y2B0_AEDAL
MLCWQIYIWFFLPIATTVAVHYECLPYPVRSVCKIEHISYHPGDQISFPAGYQQYHIRLPKSMRKTSSRVTHFDHQLYEAMHRPTSIEMIRVGLKELSLPTKLLLGDFSNNEIDSVNTTNEDNFHITYLDLSSNKLRNMNFVSALVNLEILHLGFNLIKVIPNSVLSTLTKLKYFYLQHNYFISSIPWNDIPRSTIHLDFNTNNLTEVVLTNISLPSLEYLNIRHNTLLKFNVTELLRAAPNLKEAYLLNSDLGEIQMRKIYAELTANNVTFKSPFKECEYDEESDMPYEACMTSYQKDSSSKISLQTVLLYLVLVGNVVVFMCIVLLVFKLINRNLIRYLQ